MKRFIVITVAVLFFSTAAAEEWEVTDRIGGEVHLRNNRTGQKTHFYDPNVAAEEQERWYAEQNAKHDMRKAIREEFEEQDRQRKRRQRDEE